ncbi:MAG TPA: carboxypeptidase-like regulatory domain-containing protein, partial [Terriglobales bacterium]|nr:carboxypeptidase-like regulatory domain-containing protein [Terriglobales bacterium]
MSRALSPFLVALVSLFLLCASLEAQTTASIEGRVLDPSGAAIAKANVTAVNEETAYSRTAVTSTTGTYQLQQLPVGSYTVTAEVGGFK